MSKKKIKRQPLIVGMEEVTERNKKRLEQKYKITIGDDVDYILAPDVIYDQESDFWDIEKSLHRKREHRGDPIDISEEDLF